MYPQHQGLNSSGYLPYQQRPPPPGSLPLIPMSGINHILHSGDYQFSLEVVQQPVRARMCGFGDKDRRQITPPLCARLRIFHKHTGQEYTDVSAIDTSFYTVIAELWSADGTRNHSFVNLNGESGYQQQQQHQQHLQQTDSNPYTRNLIGSLAATAFKLYDLSDTLGIWFILQDLSVRTEGEFRLKLSFVNLADTMGSSHIHTNHNYGNSSNNIHNFQNTSGYPHYQQPPPHSYQHYQGGSIDVNAAGIICSTFSQPFRSYSAKKFPGVIDSTDLSRCFASQGIKILIRRDKKHRQKQ